MKAKNRWQKVGPIDFHEICWPVKIRVRAEPPLLAPRTPPVFPASPVLAAKRACVQVSVVPEYPAPWRLTRKVESHDWRVLGEQDDRMDY